jgi:hypothetical protein
MTNTTFVEPLDDVYLDTAQTRSEVMRARGYGDDSTARVDETPTTQKPKRQQRTYDERYRRPTTRKATITAMPASSPEPSTPVQSAAAQLVHHVDVPTTASDSARLVSLVSSLVSAGLHVAGTLDGAHIDVR